MIFNRKSGAALLALILACVAATVWLQMRGSTASKNDTTQPTPAISADAAPSAKAPSLNKTQIEEEIRRDLRADPKQLTNRPLKDVQVRCKRSERKAPQGKDPNYNCIVRASIATKTKKKSRQILAAWVLDARGERVG